MCCARARWRSVGAAFSKASCDRGALTLALLLRVMRARKKFCKPLLMDYSARAFEVVGDLMRVHECLGLYISYKCALIVVK